MIDALSSHPLILQKPANTIENYGESSPFNEQGPVGEPEFEDVIDITEITPPRNVHSINYPPHLQPAFDESEEGYNDETTRETVEEKSAQNNVLLFELADNASEDVVSDVDNDTSVLNENMDEDVEIIPKKKKKKKKEKEKICRKFF